MRPTLRNSELTVLHRVRLGIYNDDYDDDDIIIYILEICFGRPFLFCSPKGFFAQMSDAVESQ